MTVPWLSQTKNGIRLAVQVSPNAKKSELIIDDNEALRVRLQAQPVDGKANEALVAFLSKKLKVPKRQIKITHGTSSRKKLLEIVGSGYTLEALEEKIRTI